MIWGTQVFLPKALRILQGVPSKGDDAVYQLEGAGRYAVNRGLFTLWKQNVNVLRATDVWILEQSDFSIFIHPLHSFHDLISSAVP
jgi:hypothetical protein